MGKKRLTKEEFIEKAKKIHGDKYNYSKVKYVNNRTKVCIICTEHSEFWQTPSDHLMGSGCKKCGHILTRNRTRNLLEEFIEKAIKIHGDKYDYSKVDYKNNKIKVSIICHEIDKNGKDHGIFYQRPDLHLFCKSGCPICKGEKFAKNRKKTISQLIQDFKIIHDDKYNYSLVNEENYLNCMIKIPIICYKHGIFTQSANAHNRGQGCPNCKQTSKGEINIQNIFIVDEINFITQYKFDDCKDKRCLPFDYYLPDYNLCIEFDGVQHDNPVQFGGISIERAIENFKDTQKKDKIKTDFCKKNNIRLLRISYKKFNKIEEILKRELKLEKKC